MNTFNFKSWKEFFEYYFKTVEGKRLIEFVNSEYKQQSKKIYPSYQDVFKAYEKCKLEKVKVVIIGQDPYFNGCANGMAFSSNFENIKTTSLSTIFKEIERSEGINNTNYKLDKWAEQGVLLINRVLTVREGSPGSHSGKGWEEFTNTVIEVLNDLDRKIIFMLWGSKAKELKPLIDNKKNYILETSHPAARGDYNKFVGSNIFKKCNDLLRENNLKEIDWSTTF